MNYIAHFQQFIKLYKTPLNPKNGLPSTTIYNSKYLIKYLLLFFILKTNQMWLHCGYFIPAQYISIGSEGTNHRRLIHYQLKWDQCFPICLEHESTTYPPCM